MQPVTVAIAAAEWAGYIIVTHLLDAMFAATVITLLVIAPATR